MKKDVKKDMYKMQYKCCNCFKTFTKEIKKGFRAYGNAGKCPFCEISDFSEDPIRTHEVLNLVT